MATHPQLTLDAQLCFPMYAATRALVRRYGELLADVDLTYPQYLAMLVLWEADAALTVGEIGERLRLDSGTLTPLLKRLERAGLVERRRDTADERRVLVSVTSRGASLQDDVADVPHQLWTSMGITPDGARQLRGLLDQVIEGLAHSETHHEVGNKRPRRDVR